MLFLSSAALLIFASLIFAGYRYRYGPFGSLGIKRMENLTGNAKEYGMSYVDRLNGSPLKDKRVLFLGSSVTLGYASLEEGIPEYFKYRFGCDVTKEAVSGTTLVDEDESSYVSRLKANVDHNASYDLAVVQLSTNDAGKGKTPGTVSDTKDTDSFDTKTIAGAIEYIIAYIRNTYGCPVLFYTNARFKSDSYQQMVDILYRIRDKWRVGVIDLWSDDGFNDIEDQERKLYMADPIHPTKAGYRDWWCPEIERQLQQQLEDIL